ncbi:MAG TPA: hypothetical protein VFX28_20635 [Methylomirabilota bacterium]|nr:hypothetical protein [Methylomirabilota bacterium]
MTGQSWNPWKATAIGMALVGATALVTGLVVANWMDSSPQPATVSAPPPPAPPAAAKPAVAARAAASTPAPSASKVPPASVVEACNGQAAAQVGPQDKTLEIVKDAAVGAVVGAAVGAAGGAIADGGKGAGKGAAIGGLVGAGGGTLYGINENRKKDERYRTAYGSCMRARGYAG